MLDDVIAAKAAIVERCVARVREEYAAAKNFRTDLTHRTPPCSICSAPAKPPLIWRSA